MEAGGPDQLLWVEHPPVLTLGRGADEGQLLASRETIRRRGVTVAITDRGGGVTYHGPGQLVGYPIVDLRRLGSTVRGYLHRLEAALIRALSRYGVTAGVREGLTGVWTQEGKLASIGIAVRRGVTRHGFALNVDTRLDNFELIRPCGLDEPVTSLERLGWRGYRPGLAAAIADELEEALGRSEPGDGRIRLEETRVGIPAAVAATGAPTAPSGPATRRAER